MSHRTRLVTAITAAAVTLGAITLAALAGDLDPPAGTIEPTMKTLHQVEPRTPINLENTPGDADSVFKITTPGSYYLTGNLKGFSGKHGIEIASSNVTIDLMGFHVSGVPGSLDGIKATISALENIAIRNGTTEGWDGHGIQLGLPNALNCAVENIRASNNTISGIRVGINTIVHKCVSFNNQDGIIVGLSCTVTECAVYQNSQGLIVLGVSCLVAHCSAYDNTTNGIVAGTGSTVTACIVRENGLHGIQTGDGCTISNCTAERNSEDGFWIREKCLVLANTSVNNGFDNDAAGIYVWGNANRIEGNHCNDNDKGIEVTGVNNYIVRNTCADNTTNFLFVINNRYGEIVDHSMTGTPPVNGNSSSSFIGTTDPWANFANDIP